jgi:hypothetical protein
LIIKKFGTAMTALVPIFRFIVISVRADPPVIEIGYNETVNVDIGMWDFDDDGFEIFNDPPLWTARYLNFEVIEYPGGNDDGSWHVVFNPYTIDVIKEANLKTNMSISLTSPPTSSNPIQSGVLKVKIKDTWAYGNIWFPPEGHPSSKTLALKLIWFSLAVLIGFGKYSGSVEVQSKDVNILVKVKPYHALKFEAIPLLTLEPDQVASIPITLQNLGNYNDTYSFRIISENYDIELATPYSITLAPGEIKETYLGVSVPQSAFDYGTLHDITVEAFSIDDPNVTIAKRTILVETKGVYVSEEGAVGLLFITIIVILGVAFYIHRRRYFFKKYCKKPEKPWMLPEEKKKLEKLKERNKEKYEETLEQMKRNYEGEISLYKDMRKTTLKKISKKQGFVSNIRDLFSGFINLFKRRDTTAEGKIKAEKKETEKAEEITKLKEKKLIEEEQKLVEKQEEHEIKEKRDKLWDNKAEAEKRKKREALSRIKREQEKQKRKLKTF